jgi:hypothetical protein
MVLISAVSIRIYLPFSLLFFLWVNIFLPGLQSGTEVEIALLQYAAKEFCTLNLLALKVLSSEMDPAEIRLIR